MTFQKSTVSIIACLALGACKAQQPASDPAPDGEPVPSATPSPEPSDTVSILRPEIENPDGDEAVVAIKPLNTVIGFPKGGYELDAEGVTALDSVLKSRQIGLGGPIILRAHSDLAGTDTANERASEKRGLTVAKWLTDKGIDAERITVIAFGEQNPTQPNAMPDGSPSEAGRAANRRVEVVIAGNQAGSPAKKMVENAGETEASAKSGD